jgi:hypothetical protein
MPRSRKDSHVDPSLFHPRRPPLACTPTLDSGPPKPLENATMSRFFAASDSSSEEESEEELYSNDEESQEDSDMDSDSDDSDDSDSSSGSETGAARFLKDADSESESDEEVGPAVLKSAKDKRFDELEAVIRQIENAQKIGDWAVISDRTSAHQHARHAAC